ADRIQCLDTGRDRSLQGGAVTQEKSGLVHWATTRLSLVLGLLMLTFGLLKCVSPTIDGWFHVQIQQSHLPHLWVPEILAAGFRKFWRLPQRHWPSELMPDLP